MMNLRYLPNGLQYCSTQDGNWAMRLYSRATHTPVGMDHRARKGRLDSLLPRSAVMVWDHQMYPTYRPNHPTSHNPQVACRQADHHCHQPDHLGGHRPDTHRHQDHQTLRLHGFLMQPT